MKSSATKEVHSTVDDVSQRHQDEKPIAVASVLATIFPNPTETNVPIISNLDLGNTVKSSNDTKGKKVMHEGQVKVDNEHITHPKAAEVGCSNPCSKDTGPSSLALVEVHTSPDSPKDLDHSISDIMEMLKSMPNNESLKDLLDFSTKWTEGCSEKWLGGLDNTTEGGVPGETSERVQEISNVLNIARSLKDGASVLAAMALDLLNMAHGFASLTPSMLHGALGFETLVSSI